MERARPGEPGTEAASRPARLAFVARSADPDDAWLGLVIERIVRRQLRDRVDRRFEVDRAEGATPIELALSRDGDRFRIEARLGDGKAPLASASAMSVAGAARSLAGALEASLGADLPPREPEPDELEEMRRLGAPSVPMFRCYRNLVRDFFATMLPDSHGLAGATREIVARDPEWAHSYALLAFLEGTTTEAARDELTAGRAAASAARDPSGADLLCGLDLFAGSDVEAAFHVFDGVFRGNDRDLLAGQMLMICAVLTHRPEEAVAIARRIYALHPDLVFGGDLAELFRGEGRDADADRTIREWAAAAPESATARVALAKVEVNAGRLEEARARAREAVAIHHERLDALPDLFEVLVRTDQISDARAIADRMLVGSPLNRARGRYRVAVAATLQSRFAAAYDTVRRAIVEHRAFGLHSELTQCLELARGLAPLVADPTAQRRHTEELADVFENLLGDAGVAAATRFELALLERRGAPPSIDEHLSGLADGPVRDVARRRMLRAAAVADCGSAPRAVAAGFSAAEDNTASLVALGLCAFRVRELDLARRSLERAAQLWSSLTSNQSSPFHAVLARFHLAGVLAELGDRAGARAAYEAFLRCWSDPDRPVPEVAIARQMLGALAP